MEALERPKRTTARLHVADGPLHQLINKHGVLGNSNNYICRQTQFRGLSTAFPANPPPPPPTTMMSLWSDGPFQAHCLPSVNAHPVFKSSE